MLPLASALLPLNDFGWRISAISLQEYFDETGAEDEEGSTPNDVIKGNLSKIVLDLDLHTIGENFLKSDFKSVKNDKIILQIDKIRNVSLPKSADTFDAVGKNSARLLKSILTDGHSSIPAIEMVQIKNLNSDTPPGTKILLYPPKIEFEHGFLLLTNKNCQILGGEVKDLIEKWRANEETRGKPRSAASCGAPPWVAFGKKIDSHQLQKGFTAMSVASNDSGPPVSQEFEQARNAVIAQAAATGETRRFRNAPINVPQPISDHEKEQPKNVSSDFQPDFGNFSRGRGGPGRSFGGRGRGSGGARYFSRGRGRGGRQ